MPQAISDSSYRKMTRTDVELVDKEVVLKQKELLVNTVIGVLKTKTEYMHWRAVPQTLIPLP